MPRSPFLLAIAPAVAVGAGAARWALQGSGNVYTAVHKRFYVPDPDLGWRVQPGGDASTVPANELFAFSSVRVSVTGDKFVRYGDGDDAREVMRFEVRNAEDYARGMTSATEGVLAAFPARVTP